MVKTKLVKLTDGEGKEYQAIFGDLTELYEVVEDKILSAEKVTDLAEGLFAMKNYLANLVQETIAQYQERQKESAKASEQNPKVEN